MSLAYGVPMGSSLINEEIFSVFLPRTGETVMPKVSQIERIILINVILEEPIVLRDSPAISFNPLI